MAAVPAVLVEVHHQLVLVMLPVLYFKTAALMYIPHVSQV